MDHLDHGILNVPLAKRGNIDAQIDRYKADQRKAETAHHKAQVAEFRALKVQAVALLAEFGDAIVARYGDKLGGAKAVRQTLDRMAKWEPAKLIAIAGKFRAEA